jgi:hypothetical protein
MDPMLSMPSHDRLTRIPTLASHHISLIPLISMVHATFFMMEQRTEQHPSRDHPPLGNFPEWSTFTMAFLAHSSDH